MTPTILPSVAASLAEFNKVAGKHNELCNRRAEIQTALARAEMPASSIGSAAVALLSDDPPADGDPVVDRETLQREESIVAKAIQLNSERLANAQAAHGRRLYADKRDEHIELIARVIESFEALADAIAAEQKFREGFNRWGTTVAPAIKTTSAPWLRYFLQRGVRDVLRRSNTERFRLEKPVPTTKGR
jgi:hypothetical protein